VLSVLAGTTLAIPLPKSKTVSTTIIPPSTSAASPPGSNLLALSKWRHQSLLDLRHQLSQESDLKSYQCSKLKLGPRQGPIRTSLSSRLNIQWPPMCWIQGQMLPRSTLPSCCLICIASPVSANVVKRDPEAVAKCVFGATPHCSTNKKLCSDANGRTRTSRVSCRSSDGAKLNRTNS